MADHVDAQLGAGREQGLYMSARLSARTDHHRMPGFVRHEMADGQQRHRHRASGGHRGAVEHQARLPCLPGPLIMGRHPARRVGRGFGPVGGKRVAGGRHPVQRGGRGFGLVDEKRVAGGLGNGRHQIGIGQQGLGTVRVAEEGGRQRGGVRRSHGACGCVDLAASIGHFGADPGVHPDAPAPFFCRHHSSECGIQPDEDACIM
ncbi:hypothetical protein CDEF62S_06394 [Castellaniella defragrans]